MSDNGYSAYSPYYQYSPSAGSYPITNALPSWNDWNSQQHHMQIFVRNALNYGGNSTSNNHSTPTGHNFNTYSSNSDTYRSDSYRTSSSGGRSSYYRNRYNSPRSTYTGNQQNSSWSHRTPYKRNRLDSGDSEPQLKTAKKKKKPFSQSVPAKRGWTLEDAQLAFEIETEHNKKSKNALIIKFPDQELNKDIVFKFHPSIEAVHFQQPCTPRFCFVTLKESANADEVISILNKQSFGNGCLSVEHKKDKDEDHSINAEDIDPLTLYVGNLAQEITKDDMVNMYPRSKRIDIGYAKKMKFTRYAFVAFRNITDSIAAFKKTHSSLMYNKSLIVRFRRLHGTVGMPGEAKPQNPPEHKDETTNHAEVSSYNTESVQNTTTETPEVEESPVERNNTPVLDEIYNSHESPRTDTLNLEQVKSEQPSPVDSGYAFNNKLSPTPEHSSFLLIESEDFNLQHSPLIKKELDRDIKKEPEIPISLEVTTEDIPFATIKDELHDNNYGYSTPSHYNEESNDSDNDSIASMIDFDNVYDNMIKYGDKLKSLKKKNT